ncbi:TonB-dependent siderophore receptor [Shinella pollutisoli]|uniref:TonB-dependent siderophore receptor n=1 Tax=Shinella pollutisoli TaxID=2250594 RepID=A0ABV7DLK1_9HYPH|nr:TonB-dependent siderophore receptor [Shinella pollutisoli]
MDMMKAGNRQSSSRYRTMVLLGCTALVALTPVAVLAQQAEVGSATVLETITVDGNGTATGGDSDSTSIVARRTTGGGKMATDILTTPATVSVITAKEIEQRGATNVEEVLNYTAGVTTDFYGSDDRYDYFKIRGFDAYMYRDGLTIGAPFGGIREEPYAFERVEVLKGANSTSFGVSDPGGSVNYVTKLPKSERFGEVYVTGGSFSHKETGFDFGDNLTADDTLSYRITGKIQDADKEYDFSRDDEKFIMGGLTWRPTDATSLSIVYDHLNRDSVPGGGGHPVGYDLDRSLFLGEPGYNYDVTNRNTVSVLFDHDFGSGLTFHTNARYSKSNTGFGYAYVYEPVDNGDTIADRYFFGNAGSDSEFIIDTHVEYAASLGSVDTRTLVGAEFSRRSGDNDLYYAPAAGIDWTNPIYSGGPVYAGPYSSTRSKRTTTALYLQEELTIDRLTASFGLRNDWIDAEEHDKLTGLDSEGDFSELTSRVGLSYKVTDELAPFVSYAQSVAPPQVGTEPERGEQYEAGVKYQPAGFPALITASIFDLTKSNVTVTEAGTPPVRSTIGEVRVRGFEVEAKAELTSDWSLTAAYAYLDSKIVEDGNGTNEGNRFAMVPEHMASLWLNYTLEGDGRRGDMTFGAGARYKGSYYLNDANTAMADSSVVFDAAFTYKVAENTSFQLNVTNIFDEKHVANGGFGADWYNPGRAIYATIRQTW